MNEKKKRRKANKRIPSGRMRQRVINVLRSFRVKELKVDVDTGDMIWNAFLHPVFYFISKGNRRFYVNYSGRNLVRLEIQNRLIKMLYAFIK